MSGHNSEKYLSFVKMPHGKPWGIFFISGRIGLSQEVKRMKRKNRFSELLRPLGALALAGATLWTVSVTAGSATAADAWAALRQEVPLTLLRWQLGDPGFAGRNFPRRRC